MPVDEVLKASLSFFVVGGFLAVVGKAMEEAIGPSREGWRGFWHRTRTIHPIAVGILLGFSGLPVPELLGETRIAAVLWFGLAGGLSAFIYEIWRGALERRAK